MPERILNEDWAEYDERKRKEKGDSKHFSCEEPWEVDHLILKIRKHEPNIAENEIKSAIQSCCNEMHAPRSREEFVICVMSKLIEGNDKLKLYKFKIEEETYYWPTEFITGAQVRTVGPGIPEDMDLFLKIRGKVGKLIKNDEKVNLADKEIEKFYTQVANSDSGI